MFNRQVKLVDTECYHVDLDNRTTPGLSRKSLEYTRFDIFVRRHARK